jgi:hypothetical protein
MLADILRQEIGPSRTAKDFMEEAKVMQVLLEEARREKYDNSEGFVWLVSVQWLDAWKIKVGYEAFEDGFEYTEEKVSLGRDPGRVNLDLLDGDFKEETEDYRFLKVADSQYAIFNVVTKPGIIEDQDFVVFSAEAWEVFVKLYPEAIEVRKIKYLDMITERPRIEINFPMVSSLLQ